MTEKNRRNIKEKILLLGVHQGVMYQLVVGIEKEK